MNEVCDLKGCNLALFFEARKKKDFYLWLARTPDGPSIKFHVLNGKGVCAPGCVARVCESALVCCAQCTRRRSSG